MTPERFRTLLQIYGTNLQRWPQGERLAARALVEEGTPELRQWLAEAALLDGWLDSHTVPAPEHALMQRVMAGADAAAHALTTPGEPWWRASWWWPSAGLMGIGLAGSLLGALTVSVALRSIGPPPVDGPDATAFSALPADWSEE